MDAYLLVLFVFLMIIKGEFYLQQTVFDVYFSLCQAEARRDFKTNRKLISAN